MNIIVRLFSRQKAKQVQVKKLMSLSFSLHHLCTLASPPLSAHSCFLNVRRPPHLSNNLSFLRMSSTISEGSNISSSANDTANTDLDSIFKLKRIIRTNVRKSLKQMDPSQRALEDDAIQRLVLDAPWFKCSRRLCAYISCRALREVDTSKKLERKTVYVPRVEDKNSHMRMLNISSVDDLIANSMDILEPALVDSRGNQREDGLAFDKSGRRLGRGGGYYDTFLSNYRQLANKQNWKLPLLVIPITPNDVYVDALVSPAGVIPISSAALERMKHSL
ncbi:5-formyltetrahydrofolate cyclo-ligase mitochondrial [Bienertia sinuspersici]